MKEVTIPFIFGEGLPHQGGIVVDGRMITVLQVGSEVGLGVSAKEASRSAHPKEATEVSEGRSVKVWADLVKHGFGVAEGVGEVAA